MIATLDIFYSLLSVLLFLTVAYGISRLLLKLIGEGEKKIDLFWSLFAGMCMIVSIYAIVMAKGITVLAPLPILIFILLKKIPPTSFKNEDKKFDLIFSPLALLVQFCIFIFFLNYSEDGILKFVSGDFSIYYRTAEMLNTNGVESLSFVLGGKTVGALTPYHYGDIWLYAFFIKLFPQNPSLVFLSAFTVLAYMFTIGLLGFIKSQFPLSTKGKYFFLLLIFAGLFAGFKVCYPFFILPGAEAYTLSIFNWGKVLLLSVLMIGLLRFTSKNQEILLCTMASIAALLYLNAIPAIFISVFLLLLLRVFKKQISFSWFLKYCLYFAGSTIVIMLFFYKIVPMLYHIPKTKATHDTLSLFLNKKYIKTSINIFIGSYFQLFTLLPYFILLIVGVLLHEKKFSIKAFIPQSDAPIFMFLLFSAGLLSWAALYPITVDTVQFFHNILAPLYVIMITSILFYILLTVKNKILSATSIILVFVSVFISASQSPFYVNTFDKGDWKKMQFFLKDAAEDENIFANVQGLQNYQYWAVKKTDMYIPLNILSYRWSNYHNVALMAPFIPINEGSIYYNEEKADVENSTFSKYFNSEEGKNATAELAILKYINTNNIKYITVSHDTLLPRFIRDNVKDSLILTKSNFNLYRL